MPAEVTIAVVLSLLSFVTSALTSAIGLGGGLLLLAVLPHVLPAQVIIPVHGATQLFSNASRWFFGREHGRTRPVLSFAGGAVLGAALGSLGLETLHLDYIPVLPSVFILLILWTPFLDLLLNLPGRYFSLGIVQTAIALYVGATGPLSTSVLHKNGLPADQVIVTNAAINVVLNVAKLAVYVDLGFRFGEYAGLIVLMAISAIAGSWVGTRLRGGFDREKARTIMKWLITLICIANLGSGAARLTGS